MSSIVKNLDNTLSGLAADGEPPARYVIAFSGGIDSTVLLHAMCRSHSSIPVVVAHVNHQLCAESAEWEAHCRNVAESLGVDYVSEQARIAADSGMGPEAAARAARYGVFENILQANDWLLTAHHEADQAETLLLNLFRGSGPSGLAAMKISRPFATGRLVRPLLRTPKAQIDDYARQENLDWIQDPSNADTRFDRNFLRNDILPLLESRWQALTGRLTRSAELAGEAAHLLDDLAGMDLETAGTTDKLNIGALALLTPARQRNLLRYAIRDLGLPSPPSTRLSQIVDELMVAREDAQPLVQWPGVEVRRYREKIYLLSTELSSTIAETDDLLRVGASAYLGSGLGTLSLSESGGAGIDPAIATSGLKIRIRDGGESIRPVGRNHAHKLKKLLQEAAVVPWMRSRIPLLFSGDKLVAVADLWIAAECSAENGYQIRWENRPAIT